MQKIIFLIIFLVATVQDLVASQQDAAAIAFQQEQWRHLARTLEGLQRLQEALRESRQNLQREAERRDLHLRECVGFDGVETNGVCAATGFYFKGVEGVEKFTFAENAAMVIPVAKPVHDPLYSFFDGKDLETHIKPTYWNQEQLYTRASIFGFLLGGLVGGVSTLCGAMKSSMTTAQRAQSVGIGVLVGSAVGAAGGYAGARLFQQDNNLAVQGFEVTVYRKLPKKKAVKESVTVANEWQIKKGDQRVPLFTQRSLVGESARKIITKQPCVGSYSESWIIQNTEQKERRA